MKTKKSAHPTSIRLSEEAVQLRKLLAERLGVSEAAVLELAIRELAERRGVKMQDQYEIRVERSGREFKAWEGNDEQLSKEQFELWKQQENVEKVGRFVNGNWAEAPYTPRVVK